MIYLIPFSALVPVTPVLTCSHSVCVTVKWVWFMWKCVVHFFHACLYIPEPPFLNLGSTIKFWDFIEMSEILAESWHPWTYSRTWTVSPVSAHSRRYIPTFFQAPKPLALLRNRTTVSQKFSLCAFTPLTLPKPWIVKHSSNFILLWTWFPSTPPPSWPHFGQIYKIGCKLCWHISLWRNVRKVFRLGVSYSPLVATYYCNYS